MIAHLNGELARVEADWVVIDVNGVGYKAYLPLAVISQLPKIGGKVGLLISTIVKEDSITLYGFMEEAEQSLFELLLTVSGVGPKVALNMLSVLTVGQITGAISSERFSRVEPRAGGGHEDRSEGRIGVKREGNRVRLGAGGAQAHHRRTTHPQRCHRGACRARIQSQ